MSASDAGGLKLTTDDVSKYVKLNVGGCLFQTTIGTLTKYDTMLQGMFGGEIPVQTDSDGFVVIDRSGKHFGVILNYLRDGDVALPASQRELQELLAEAEYYRVEGLITGIQARVSEQQLPVKQLVSPSVVANSYDEAVAFIQETKKPVVMLSSGTQRSTPNEDRLIKFYNNNHLFDELAMKYHNRILFIRYLGESAMYWSFIKPTQREFYTSNDDGFGGRRLRKTGFEQNNCTEKDVFEKIVELTLS